MGESRGQETWFKLVTFHNYKFLMVQPPANSGGFYFFLRKNLVESRKIVKFAYHLKLKDYGYNKIESWRPHNV